MGVVREGRGGLCGAGDGQVSRPGGWRPVRMRGRFGARTENRALWARFRQTCMGGVRKGRGGLCGAGDGQVRGLGGLEAGPRERAAVCPAWTKTERWGLGFCFTCMGGVREGRGGLCGAGNGQVSRPGGLEAGPHERGAVWRANPKTEPCGLGFGQTCMGGVRKGRGGLCGAGDGQVSGLGGLEAGPRERAAVWHARPKTEPCGLGFGWTYMGGVREGRGGLCGAGNGQVSGPGGLEGGPRERGAVWRANPKTEPYGLGFSWTCIRGVREGKGGVVWCGGWPSERAWGAGGRSA